MVGVIGQYVLAGHTATFDMASPHFSGSGSATDRRRVAETFVGRFRVSTMFLGLDHNFTPHGVPRLFETMVFKGQPEPKDGDDPWPRDTWAGVRQERCSTWDEAEAQHAEVVADLLAAP